jgi:hypothetical protein
VEGAERKSHKANRSLIPLVKWRVVYICFESLCPSFIIKKTEIIGYSKKLAINWDLFAPILVRLTVPCRHEMRRPHICAGGDGFEMWIIAANWRSRRWEQTRDGSQARGSNWGLRTPRRNITLKGSNVGASHSVLLFFWTWSIIQYSETRPLLFASWLCRHLQVKRLFCWVR